LLLLGPVVLGVGLLPVPCAELDKSKLPPAIDRQIDFMKDVRPILEKSCYACHGPEKQKNGFRLDVREVALKGGDDGLDIIPGKGAESPLIHYVAGLVEDRVMPKKGDRLTPLQVATLRAWIDQGAHWPEENLHTKTDHWAFRAAVRPSVPNVKNHAWPRNPIDNFILSKLEAEGLFPSPEADRKTMIRRLSFDLIGLPPTPEEVDQFMADIRPDGYERLVDRLLDSPRYGERWARHWLDVVHYGESHGYDKDKPRPNAWPYRDYTIRAFNEDKPYSRFVQEQIAGDVLFRDSAESTIATGFIATGPWDFVGHVELPESKTDGLIARYNDRDDMVMNTMSTFLSLTVHCARCHDHKFDPISQEEYYRLQAVFAGVDRVNRPVDTDPQMAARRRTLMANRKKVEARKKELDSLVAKVTSAEVDELDRRLKTLKEERKAIPKPEKESPSNGYHSGIEPKPEVEKWVQVDLGDHRVIDSVRLIPARPTDFADTPGFGFPRRFRMEASDDPEFGQSIPLLDASQSDYPNPGDTPLVIQAKAVQARFVRITATRLWERTQDYVFALAELQVLSGTNNVAFQAKVAALDSIEAGRWGRQKLVDNFDSRNSLVEPAEAPEVAAKRKELDDQIKRLGERREATALAILDPPVRDEIADVGRRLAQLNSELESLPKAQMVYAAASDFKPEGSFVPPNAPREIHLLRRGDVKRPGPLVEPGALSCLGGLDSRLEVASPNEEGDRRAALARWITDPKNVLSRRSIVNRLWQYHFGRGIVDSPNDFGHMGSLPTHPELLDWLALWFLDQGESLKQLHRLLVTSATYRQTSSPVAADARRLTSNSEPGAKSSEAVAKIDADSPIASGIPARRLAGSRPPTDIQSLLTPAAAAVGVDSDNRLLWRMNRARLDAESFRDALLCLSGQLDLTMGGPSLQQFYFKDDHSPVYDYTQFDVDSPAAVRRGVYRFIVRSVPDPFMECLDSADPSLLTAKRNVTLTALQALTTLNNPFVVRQCEHFAARLQRERTDLPGQIERAYTLALSRPPRPDEANRLRDYARKHGLPNACRVLINSSEFVFVD